MCRYLKFYGTPAPGEPGRSMIQTMTAFKIQQLIRQGETATVEFKTKVVPSHIFAREISAFANTNGGTILVGIDKRDGGIVGCVPEQLTHLFETARREIKGQVDLVIDFVEIQHRLIGVISVGKSKEIVSSRGGIFVRHGEAIRAMTAQEIQERMPPEDAAIGRLTELIAEQTNTIEELHEEIRKSNSWKLKSIDYLIGGLVGALIGLLLTLALT